MTQQLETVQPRLTQFDLISHDYHEIFPIHSYLESPTGWYSKPTDKSIYEAKLPDQIIEDIMNQSKVVDVSNPVIYEEYLKKLKEEHLAEYGHFANKANIQLECQKLGINEDTTRMIAPNDLGTLFKYVKELNDKGRIVWIGSSTKDDMTDPWGDKSEINNSVTPPLYKKITSLEDLIEILPSINLFKMSHPDMLLKVFPQDRENPTLTSIVFEHNKQSKKISFHFKPGQFLPDGLRNDKPSRTIDVEVDLNDDIPIITIEDESDLEWVEIVLNSLDMFAKVQKIDINNSPVVNFEAMHLNSDSTLSFVTDIIYGNGDKKKKFKKIPFLKMLKSVKDGIVVYKNSTINAKSILANSNNLIRELIDLRRYNKPIENQKYARELIQLIDLLDLEKIHLNIPSSILRNLVSISEGNSPTQSITKAILHLQNSITILHDIKSNDNKIRLLPNRQKGWRIIR